ncbi:MAG: hypothetical protein Q8R25_02675 [bacterium]|nr:hypothetical protein [bacterium]
MIAQGPVGVVVGRFQEHSIKAHEGHMFTLQYALDYYEDVLILLAVPGSMRNDRYPLPFNSRQMMIHGAFPVKRLRIMPLDAHVGPHTYRSSQVDEIIKREYPDRIAELLGSRDSILDTYSGEFAKVPVPHVYSGSATQIRESIVEIDSDDFRAGIIWDILHRPPIAYPTVDVPVVSGNLNKVLVIRKKGEGGVRFPGVFFDPSIDDSFESAAIRCVRKELPGVKPGQCKLLFSHKIQDPRYRKSRDGIITMMAQVTWGGGEPVPSDDVIEIKWIDRFELSQRAHEILVPEHRVLGEKIIRYWNS